MRSQVIAACYVAFAALLWGADSLVQIPALAGVPSTALTFYEHLLGLVLLIPFVSRPSRRELGSLRPRHIVPLFLVGIAGETLGGIFFGEGYHNAGAAASGFLQMLQPFCVLAIVWALGRERNASSYLAWAMSVLFGALVIWIFDSSFDVQALEEPRFWSGVSLGFLAVVLWAASNVSGKILLETFSPSSVVFLRWSLSLFGRAVVIWAKHVPLDAAAFLTLAGFSWLLIHAVLFALLPLWIFYRGLRLLPASLTTFIELACPLALAFLPGLLGHKHIQQIQWLGGFSVVVGVILLLRLELEFVLKRR
jgi:DME family drug/metabolite transporter